MDKSPEIKNLAIALNKFQAEMENVIQGSNNPFYNSKYATLAEIIDCCRERLAKNGLSISQLPSDEGSVITILMHISGEYLMSKLSLKALIRPQKDEKGEKYMPNNPDPQSVGSAITYARRYSYAAILGIATEEDDDGNAASARDAKTFSKSVEQPKTKAATPTPPPPTNQASDRLLNDDEIKYLIGLAKSKGFSSSKILNEWMLKNFNTSDMKQLQYSKLPNVITALQGVANVKV